LQIRNGQVRKFATYDPSTHQTTITRLTTPVGFTTADLQTTINSLRQEPEDKHQHEFTNTELPILDVVNTATGAPGTTHGPRTENQATRDKFDSQITKHSDEMIDKHRKRKTERDTREQIRLDGFRRDQQEY